MTEAERVVAEVEALRIGPDERLILRVPASWSDFMDDLQAQFARIGLAGRVLIFAMDEPLEAYLASVE